MTAARDSGHPAPVGLVTYSVKPRGGVVHTLALAETLHAAGYPVRVIALGDPGAGFFRPVAAPFTIIAAPPSLPTLEERVFANVDALAAGLGPLAAEYPILHTQDCISARAACRVRDGMTSAPPVVIRTVHHVDDFTSPSLIECQRQAILEPDRILVVSERWRDILAEEYGTRAEVVHNGVDVARFATADPALAAALRKRAGAGPPGTRPLILAVGGIEPRKGSDTLMKALAGLRQAGRRPVLAVVGGHSFQDYREYRDRVLASIPDLGLRLDDDVVLLGTVPDAELPGWYAAADVLAFPSTKEGWGLAVLEAMSAGLPVVASDLPVFREYLRPGRDALMVPADDAGALAAALASVLDDEALAARLRAAGHAVPARFTWAASAAEHQGIYASARSLSSRSAPFGKNHIMGPNGVGACMTWLVPGPGPERDRLAAVIADLAAGYGGPVFAPHLTLARTVEAGPDAVAGVLAEVTAGAPPFEVTLTGAGWEPVFFRALYLRAEPSARLTALRAAAQRAFGLEPAPDPHLSLLYADLDEDRKPAIAAGLALALPMTIRVDAAEVWGDSREDAGRWRRLARVPLAG